MRDRASHKQQQQRIEAIFGQYPDGAQLQDIVDDLNHDVEFPLALMRHLY